MPELVFTTMYDKRENREQKMTATYGRPERDVRKKHLGALPVAARPYKPLDDKYKSLEEADHAEVRITAFRIEGRYLIPARLIAITNGDDEAFEESRLKRGLSEGTSNPMTKTPPM